MRVNLAKALKLKNRLTGRVGSLIKDVTAYNCVPKGQQRPDVRTTFETYTKLQGLLIGLKTAITIANNAIVPLIIEMQELKGRVAALNGLNTRGGMSPGSYGSQPVEYDAVLTKGEVDGLVGELEGRIDTLQDKIDAHNHNTLISISDDIFEPGMLTAKKPPPK